MKLGVTVSQEGKGVHRKVESEGSLRQIAEPRNTNLIGGGLRRVSMLKNTKLIPTRQRNTYMRRLHGEKDVRLTPGGPSWPPESNQLLSGRGGEDMREVSSGHIRWQHPTEGPKASEGFPYDL